MKKMTIAIAAAAGLAAGLSAVPFAPVLAASGPKVAEIGVEIRGDRDREHFRDHDRCREVTIRERRGDATIVRHERRCD